MTDERVRPLLVLVHSPLAGPVTWASVHQELTRRGVRSTVPELLDDGGPVYWEQHAGSIASQVPDEGASVVLVGHSGAGPLLPAIAAAVPAPVDGLLFVDAGLPSPGRSRLDAMRDEDPEFATWLEEHLAGGGRFPEWTFEDLGDVVDRGLRRRLIDELRPRGLDYFTEPLPAHGERPDISSAYLQLSPAYDRPATRARALGWPSASLDATHFHMLARPDAVTEMMLGLVGDICLPGA